MFVQINGFYINHIINKISLNGGKVKHKLRVTSSNPRVTGSNPRVRRLKARVARLKAPVRRLNARFEAIQPRVI